MDINKSHENFIKKFYLKLPIKSMARIIGRSQCYVRGVMERKYLTVPKELIELRRAQSRFHRGSTPPNKGIPQKEFFSEESLANIKSTQFKKGSTPANTLFDGAISIRKGHGHWYSWIRQSKGNWGLLHRVIWREAHGPIRKGYNVQFKDGDSLNCALDNLYMVHRVSQVRVNKLGGNKLPYELKQAIILTNKLRLKVHEKQNQ